MSGFRLRLHVWRARGDPDYALSLEGNVGQRLPARRLGQRPEEAVGLEAEALNSPLEGEKLCLIRS